jgi:hypothetical protein
MRGTPIGPTFSAHARVLPPDASRRAVKAVDKRYAWGRVLHVVERLVHRKRFTGIAISALTPLSATDVTDVTRAPEAAASQRAAGAAR